MVLKKPDTAYPDRCAQRDHDGSDRDATATVQTKENVWLYYMTQVSIKPPTFVIFVNDKELMHFSYTRYLENKIREAFGFRGTSLKFIIRERNGEK